MRTGPFTDEPLRLSLWLGLIAWLLGFVCATSSAAIVLNEVMTSNSSTLLDEDGDSSDWIELFNDGSEAIDLEGYSLSDQREDLRRWVFESSVLSPQTSLLIFASGKDRQFDRDKVPLVDPSSLEHLSLWLASEDAMKLAPDRGELDHRVDAWQSRSSDALTLASSESKSGPLLLSNALNGLPVLRFDPASSPLSVSNLSTGQLAAEESMTLFVVQRTHAPRDTGSTIFFETESQRRINLHAPWSDNVLYFDFGRVLDRGRMAIAAPKGFLDEWRLVTLVREPDGTGSVFVGGVLSHRSRMNGALDGTEVGRLSVGAFDYQGDVAEIVMVKEALMPELRRGVEHYLAERYQLPVYGRRLHTSFKLKATGEELFLSNPDGNEIDAFPAVPLTADQSFGRAGESPQRLGYFAEPSPGASNSEKVLDGPLSQPIVSHDSGAYEGPLLIRVTHSENETILRYTLDGKEPSLDSPILSGELEIDFDDSRAQGLSQIPSNPSQHRDELGFWTMPEFQRQAFGWLPPVGNLPIGRVLRVRAFSDGQLPSDVVTRTFLDATAIERPGSLPILSLTLDPREWFDPFRGLSVGGDRYDPDSWSNRFWGTGNYFLKGRYAERPAVLEGFSKFGVKLLSQRLGARLHGGGSRAQPQKAFRLVARNALGASSFPRVDGFPGQTEGARQLVLRNAGQDSAWQPTLIRDSVIQACAPARAFALDIQPAQVFINGEFWGIYQWQQHYNEEDLRRRFDLGETRLDLIEVNAKPRAGDAEAFYDLLELASSPDASAVEMILERIDVENFVEHYITQLFFGNTDWPHNNIGVWRTKVASDSGGNPRFKDGRWRWLLFGTEAGFGLGSDVTHNSIAHVLGEEVNGSFLPAWSTAVFRKLVSSAPFRFHFLARFASAMNHELEPARVVRVIREKAAEIADVMPAHVDRWRRPESVESWEEEIRKLESFAEARPEVQREQLISAFGLVGNAHLSFSASPPEGGEIRIQGLTQAERTLTWLADTGNYFHGVPLSLRADPRPGFRFKEWQGSQEGQSPFLFFLPQGQQTVIAVFDQFVFFRDFTVQLSDEGIQLEVSVQGSTIIDDLKWERSLDLLNWTALNPDQIDSKTDQGQSTRWTAHFEKHSEMRRHGQAFFRVAMKGL